MKNAKGLTSALDGCTLNAKLGLLLDAVVKRESQAVVKGESPTKVEPIKGEPVKGESDN